MHGMQLHEPCSVIVAGAVQRFEHQSGSCPWTIGLTVDCGSLVNFRDGLRWLGHTGIFQEKTGRCPLSRFHRSTCRLFGAYLTKARSHQSGHLRHGGRYEFCQIMAVCWPFMIGKALPALSCGPRGWGGQESYLLVNLMRNKGRPQAIVTHVSQNTSRRRDEGWPRGSPVVS